jgi:PEP-CTERM motif
MPNQFTLARFALVLMLAVSGTAQAAITVYKTQALYLAAVSAVGVDTYDDLNPTGPLATPQTRTAGTYVYTASAGPDREFFPAGTLGGDVWLSTSRNTDSITFSGFSSDVRGFGGFFFTTDDTGALTASPATINFSATDASGSEPERLTDPTPSSFLGFVSTGAFSSVKLWVGVEGTGVFNVFASVNDLTLGAAAVAPPVPEPETYALMLGGLALLVGLARNKKA